MKRRLTVAEAAAVIGCSPSQVRALIRNGKLRAKRVPTDNNQYGYEFRITRAQAEHHRDNPNPQGWERGKPRK